LGIFRRARDAIVGLEIKKAASFSWLAALEK
jgi:hypothetical protein